MIVIDPGHSGRYLQSVDRATGLHDIDYPNYPEIYEVFDVSSCLGKALELDGYRVRLVKKHPLDAVSLADRAKIANDLRAALAVSIHDDHGQSADFQATYDQRGVPDAAGRYHAMYRGTGSRRSVFDRPAVARKSQAYAKIIAAARARAQHRPVDVRENSFTGRAPLEPGNLALVQLFSRVPWVYNEMGAKTAGNSKLAMSITSEHGYATGLLLGIEKAVPRDDGGVDQPSLGAKSLRSCLVRRVEPRPGKYTRPQADLPYQFRR